MKTSAENKRINNEASHTALIAALYRFLASKERKPGFTGPDNMAYLFLPLKARFFLSIVFFRNLIKKKLSEKSPGSYEYVSASTRFFDSLFIQALKTHIPQIVILGTGSDPTGESLFIWEGVTMYISEEAVDRTLDFVRYNSGPGSSIAFDYLYKSVIQGKCFYYGAEELTEIAKKGGEALSFGIEEGEIEEFLACKGFTPLVHYSPQLLEAKYLYDEKGGFFGNVYGFACNVHARLSAASKKHAVN